MLYVASCSSSFFTTSGVVIFSGVIVIGNGRADGRIAMCIIQKDPSARGALLALPLHGLPVSCGCDSNLATFQQHPLASVPSLFLVYLSNLFVCHCARCSRADIHGPCLGRCPPVANITILQPNYQKQSSCLLRSDLHSGCGVSSCLLRYRLDCGGSVSAEQQWQRRLSIFSHRADAW